MVKNLPSEITIKCVFCQSTKFEVPNLEDKPRDGESIKCGNCGKLNDVTSLKKVAIEEGKDAITIAMQDHFKNLFKKK